MKHGVLRLFRRFAMVVYVLALPFCLLVLFMALAGTDAEGHYQPNWALGLGSVVAMGVLAWRLRLNRRALGHSATMPPPGRLLRVFIPASLGAAAGLLLAILGAFCIWLGLWLVFDTDHAPSLLDMPAGVPEAMVSAALLISLGLAFVTAGAMPGLFFLRLFRTRAPEASSPDKSVDLEAEHD